MLKGYESASQMNIEELFAKTASAGLREFGVKRDLLTEEWSRVNAERGEQTNPIRVICGLNNADREGVLLQILKDDPEKVFAGMAIAGIAVNADEKWLYVPEEEADLASSIQKTAEPYGVTVKNAFINCRESRGSAFHHIETMAALEDIFAGDYEPGTWMAVKTVEGGTDKEERKPLRKIAFGTKIADILREDGINTDHIGAVALDTSLRGSDILETAIEEDTPIGNGVITVYDDKCCMIHETEKVLLSERKHSCGRCTFCREGLVQLHETVKDITNGKAKKTDPDLMQEIGEAMTFSCSCTMGDTASEIVLSGLENFSSVYNDHIKKKKCKTGVCTAFMSIYIDPHACTGCEDCVDVCPADAIEGKSGYIHMIDEFECTKCGKCIPVCDEEAIIQTDGRIPKLPKRLTKVGRFKK